MNKFFVNKILCEWFDMKKYYFDRLTLFVDCKNIIWINKIHSKAAEREKILVRK